MLGRVQLLLNKISKKKSQISLGLFCLLVIFLSVLFRVPGISSLIEEVDNKIYDQTIRLGWHSHPVNTRVVIIDIDEKAIRVQGRWPWPRDIMADLLTKLKQAGVVTIGLDMVLSDPAGVAWE